MVAQKLEHWPLMLKVQGLITAQDEKFSGSEYAALASLTGMMLIKSTILQSGLLTGGSLCWETSPVQDKGPTTKTKSHLRGPACNSRGNGQTK